MISLFDEPTRVLFHGNESRYISTFSGQIETKNSPWNGDITLKRNKLLTWNMFHLKWQAWKELYLRPVFLHGMFCSRFTGILLLGIPTTNAKDYYWGKFEPLSWIGVQEGSHDSKGWSLGAWTKCQVAVWRACSWFSTSTAADRLKLIDDLWRTSINLSNLRYFLTKTYRFLTPLFFSTLSKKLETFSIHVTLDLKVKPVVHTTILEWGGVHRKECWVEVAGNTLTPMLHQQKSLQRSHWFQILWDFHL